jgi:hypothetical protein
MFILNYNSTLQTRETKTAGFEAMYLVRIIEFDDIHMIYTTSGGMQVLSFCNNVSVSLPTCNPI